MSLATNTQVLLHNGWNDLQYTQPPDKLLVAERSASFILPTLSNTTEFKSLYRITFSDGSTLKATEDHLLKVKLGTTSNWSLTSIAEIRDYLLKHPSSISNPGFYCCFGNCKTTSLPNSVHSIEIEPIDYPFNFSPTPLCLLPSYWIGVLTIKGILDKEEPEVVLDGELRELMNQQCQGLKQHRVIVNPNPYEMIHQFHSDVYVDSRSQLSIDLENLGLLYSNKCNRFIHNSYLFTSSTNRIDLLRGLMDAGGYIDFRDGGVAKLRVFSPLLVENIYLLVRSLGGYVEISKLGSVWTLTIFPPPTLNPFSREGLAINYQPPNISPIPPRYINFIQPETEVLLSTCLTYNSPTALLLSKSLTGLDYIASRCP